MNQQQPDVSVIVAAYNGMPYIERMLDSLVSQTIGLARMQVLIVDDGSTDETPAVLDRMAAAHPEFEVVHQANFGRPAGPRNRALESVRGRYIFFLDQDDYVSDDALEAMVRAADDNGTDVVLARFKGVGGRGTPRTMFARTVPRTDVFSSSAYWTLNPMKLFRASMVRSLGMKFAEDSPWGEDEPFVATAYLKGSGISILADKDYVFWVYRDDLSNITTSALALADRMPVVDRMFDLVAANVPPGPGRDRLLQRHFRVEMGDSAFEGYRTETDPGLRAAAFVRFRQIVDSYYNKAIEAALPPADRVLMLLISEGRADEFAAYLDALAQAGTPRVLEEEGHLFLELPWFRDPDKGLLDDLFSIEAQLKAECRVEPLVIDPSGVRLDAACRLGALTDRVTDVSLVVRSRVDGDRAVIPLAHKVVEEEVRPFVLVEDILPSDRFLAGLSDGRHDLYMRVASGGTWRERKLSESAPPMPGLRIVHRVAEGGSATSAALKTTLKGTLSLRVLDGVGADVRLRDEGSGPWIEVSQVPATPGASVPVLRLKGEGGSVDLPLLCDSLDDSTRVLSFDARGLAPGTYTMRLVLPGFAEDFALVAANRAHGCTRTTDGGGHLRLDGDTIVVVQAWRYLVDRISGRLRRAFRPAAKGSIGR